LQVLDAGQVLYYVLAVGIPRIDAVSTAIATLSAGDPDRHGIPDRTDQCSHSRWSGFDRQFDAAQMSVSLFCLVASGSESSRPQVRLFKAAHLG
jgi:hypothetical protein